MNQWKAAEDIGWRLRVLSTLTVLCMCAIMVARTGTAITRIMVSALKVYNNMVCGNKKAHHIFCAEMEGKN